LPPVGRVVEEISANKYVDGLPKLKKLIKKYVLKILKKFIIFKYLKCIIIYKMYL
jgi:hypothetical protein